ncbi:PI31 proteasome regulator N-terminal-domain-containing protein [Favolaschia claudopus]|uniref:PI31 proteasome regulator N-terminal-domain-containing protein n=1 Tax=Favolaschia claudopus TaxID=2862362 RepID=A0AAW0E807_9AGAR
MTDPLDAAGLISLLPTLLPPSKQALSSSQDGIAALIHTALTALAFRLVGIDDSSTTSSSLTVLPEDWNKNGPSHYTFRYKHDQSSLEFLVKVSKLGGRTLINAIAFESDKASSLDIATNDFVSPSFFPHNLSNSDATPLIHGFISSNRVSDLMSQFKLKIIQTLVPGLRKDGYTETSRDVPASTSHPPPRAEEPRINQPPSVFPPDFPGANPNPYQLPPTVGPRNPLEIGRRDLDPFPGLPTNPFSPLRGIPGGDGDGMFAGPGHPMFGGGGQRGPRGGGPWGGDGFLPPMGAPPGARFDPVGPSFPGGGLGRGRGGPRRNLGEPDNDEFMPPGLGNVSGFAAACDSTTRMSSPTTPSSPTSPARSTHSRTSPQMRHKTVLPSGFRAAPKPKRDIHKMSLRELQDLHDTNNRLLSSPRESTSTDAWTLRVTAEQAQVANRLRELGMNATMDAISTELKNTAIKAEDDMNVDPPPEPFTNARLEAKRKALSRFGPSDATTHSMSMQEAIELEQHAHQQDKERQERVLEKKRRMGMPIPGEQLTDSEKQARIWAFMNYKPTDSDLEGDDEEFDDSDDDPAFWFADDDEGDTGSQFVEPDEEDYGDIIRVDGSKLPSAYSTFYEPREDD